MGERGAGRLRERLVLQSAVAPTLRLSSLTRSGTTATATTYAAHGYATGDYVTVADAVETAYNVKAKITVTGTTTFTYTVAGSPSTPATGAPTVTYVSDAQGGRRTTWVTYATVAAELVPLTANERLQLASIRSERSYRFRVRARTDVLERHRAVWTPRWPPEGTARNLEIVGILPVEDGRAWQHLECAESPR